MGRFAWVAIIVCGGCGDARRPTPRTADAQPIDAPWVAPDVAPPSVDAAPAPMPACVADAGLCPLPPSTCLDSWYLVYYTGGDCTNGTCQFETHVMYCGGDGCQNGGCLPAFT
jgi:hypothetical protein